MTTTAQVIARAFQDYYDARQTKLEFLDGNDPHAPFIIMTQGEVWDLEDEAAEAAYEEEGHFKEA